MSRSASKPAGAAFAFRLDTPIPGRVFAGEVQVTGWLLHRTGEPIHGIRAVVEKRFRRRRICRARRKRSRLDAAAAFPELPGAKSSGFLLQIPLSLGKQRVRLEVQDAARVWRLFHLAQVRALPLQSLARLGFPRVRRLLLGSLTRSYGAQNILRAPATPDSVTTSRPRASTIRRVELFATSKSNLFIREIGELLAAGFAEVGIPAQLHLDQPPVENPPDELLQIVVTPHEFFNLYLTQSFSREDARRLARGAILLGTEQPETRWFQSNLQWAPSARGMADIHPLGVLAYCTRDMPCHHLALGYHPRLRSRMQKPSVARSVDITFLGSLTDRREEFFARHAEFFSQRPCHLRFVPLDFAKTKTTRSYLDAEKRNALLANSKILLNVHYSEQRYFEWHRLLVGLANGCCIITETCEGHGPLVPGEHFIMVEPENLIPACEYYLAQPNECARIAEQGFAFVEKHLRQAQLCENFLRDLPGAGCAVPRDAAAVPLPRALRRNFARLRRRDFSQAVAADLHEFMRAPALPAEPKPAPSNEMVATQRAQAIERRSAYHVRLEEQESRRATGENVWTLHDNDSYAAGAAPVISVVITLYNYARFIRDCVASIESSASQLGEVIEVIVVEDASTDDSLAQALVCQKDTGLPMRIVAKHFNTGLADARNVGIRLARAAFVFMMDADNLIYPPALRELFAAISVGERAAAYSLLARFRETPRECFGLLSPFPWDPQILVQQPYVDAMALFRRDVLLELEGYDSQLSQIGWFGWEDYDLWLRLAARDLPVGFVPNILCLYRQHDISMLSLTNLFELDLVSHFYERFSELSDRFEPQATLFGVDRRKIRKGKCSFFIASGCPIATTTLYRCVHLQEQLARLSHEANVAEWFNEEAIDLEEALSYDVIVLYRLPMSARVRELLGRAQKTGKRVIFDTDDLVFEPDLISWHRAVAQLSEKNQEQHRMGVQRYLETLLAANVVLTSTPLLAEYAAARGKQTYVHRNALGQAMSRWADELYEKRKRRQPSGKVILGYGSGTATHDVDFEEAATALSEILDNCPQTELWIAGPLTLPDALSRFGDRVRLFPLTNWRGWFELMSEMDIALAPLEANNLFCRAKSEIKFVEAGAMGLPVVASRIDPFAQAISEGENGILAGTSTEWKRALQLLIEQPEKRLAMGEAARLTVAQRYSPEARTSDLAKILKQIGCGERITGSAAALLKLNWLIPEPFPGAGGDMGIFRIIRYLAEFGHDCRVYVVAYDLMNDFDSERVRKYIHEHFGPTRAHYERWDGVVRDADATFATFWPTAENLLALPNGGRRYYLVQDFEPSFYPDDPRHYERAEKTYQSGLRCITLGPWLAKLLRVKYGAKASYFDFAVDTHTYFPRPGQHSGIRRVCFYARPATPRRAYELGLKAFELLHQQLPEVEIVFFGADALIPTPSFPHRNWGKVSQGELAKLYSSCDVGVVFSLSNPSFVPLEMMACACAVVELASERWEGILTHGKDAWLVDSSPEAVANGVKELFTNDSLRERLVEAGLQRTRTMSWRNSARQVETILLSDDS